MEDFNQQQTQPMGAPQQQPTAPQQPLGTPQPIEPQPMEVTEFVEEKKSRYLLALVAALLGGAVLGWLTGVVTLWINVIYLWIVVVVATILAVITKAVANKSGIVTALIAAVGGVIAVYTFTYYLESQDIIWEDGSAISDDMLLYMLGAAAICGYLGFKADDDDKADAQEEQAQQLQED